MLDACTQPLTKRRLPWVPRSQRSFVAMEQNTVDEHYSFFFHGAILFCVHLHLKLELKIRLLETFNFYLIMRI